MNRACYGVLIVAVILLAGCGSKPRPPLEAINAYLKDVPSYSVILDDMREEGNFSKKYFHRYKVLLEDPETKGKPAGNMKDPTTDWMEVPKEWYQQNLPYLGMVIFSKKDGKIDQSVVPPGYQYVGDPRYGSWATDSRGNSFWAFYGQYALLSSLLGGRPIYRDDYREYNDYRSRGQTYYGPARGGTRQYGTGGSVTRQQKPDFFSRRMKQEQVRKSSFGQKVNNRIGRTRTSVRGRSGGVGK